MKKKFEINIEIYDEDIVRQAISDFSEVGIIEYSNGVIIVSGENKEEIEEIFNELVNYIISLINE